MRLPGILFTADTQAFLNCIGFKQLRALPVIP